MTKLSENGGRPYDAERMTTLIHYIGQTPLRAGRVALAAILHRSDFGAYARLGTSITGASYIKAREPGLPVALSNPLRAAWLGWRWGRVSHRLMTGRLRRADAEWIERQWHGKVPL